MTGAPCTSVLSGVDALGRTGRGGPRAQRAQPLMPLFGGNERRARAVTAVPEATPPTMRAETGIWAASAWCRRQRETQPFPRDFHASSRATDAAREGQRRAQAEWGGAVREEEEAGRGGNRSTSVTGSIGQVGEEDVRAEIAMLRRQLADRDEEVARLREALAGRSEAAERMSQQLAEREGEMQRLRSALERPAGMSDRSAQLAEHDFAREELDLLTAFTVSGEEHEGGAVAQRASDALRRTSARFEEEPHRRRMAAIVDEVASTLGWQLTLIGDLGSGKFADVVLVRQQCEGGRELAVKVAEGEFDMELLRAESENIAYLSSLPGSKSHIVQQIVGFTELEVELGGEGRIAVGAVALEKAEGDLEGILAGVLDGMGGQANKSTALSVIETMLGRWERSLMWLHAQGCLHLDIKPENAVVFGDGQCCAVKLIDLSGMITRRHIPDLPDHTPNPDLIWDTADLQRAGLEYICTDAYCQPREMSRGGRLLDYTIDWWSVGVSKMELLRLTPAFFGEEVDTAGLVLEALLSGRLENTLREAVACMSGVEDELSQDAGVSRWVESILCNLQGKPAPLD